MPDAAKNAKSMVPFHVQAAKASWVATLAGIVVFNLVGIDAETQQMRTVVASMAGAFYAVGFLFAVWAIVVAFRQGPRKILVSASFGLLINGFTVFRVIEAFIVSRQPVQRAETSVKQSEDGHALSPSKIEAWRGLKTHVCGTPVAFAELAVVLLHGYGAPGSDLVALSNVIDAPPRTAFLFPEGPDTLEQGGRA